MPFPSGSATACFNGNVLRLSVFLCCGKSALARRVVGDLNLGPANIVEISSEHMPPILGFIAEKLAATQRYMVPLLRVHGCRNLCILWLTDEPRRASLNQSTLAVLFYSPARVRRPSRLERVPCRLSSNVSEPETGQISSLSLIADTMVRTPC